jgi:hypothetical protein
MKIKCFNTTDISKSWARSFSKSGWKYRICSISFGPYDCSVWNWHKAFPWSKPGNWVRAEYSPRFPYREIKK